MNFARKPLFSTLVAGLALVFTAGLARAESPTVAPEIDSFMSTKTRAEVRAETLLAIQTGQIVRTEADEKRLAFSNTPSMLTRAQVLAEAAEARRLGLVAHGDQATPVATPAQLELVRMAGQRALVMTASR